MPKILIVDDDRAIAELVSDALEDEGFSTVLAHDGKTALALIQQAQDFSLIILDIMMPEMDGVENRVEGLDSGANDYLVKPFHLEKFRLNCLPRNFLFWNIYFE